MKTSTSKRGDDYQLVSRLVQYAFRVFNLDMNGFFMKYCDVFDQTPAEMKRDGETLEQYEVFQKYEEQLDKHMDSFVTKEGFNSVEECFRAIERAVKTDKVSESSCGFLFILVFVCACACIKRRRTAPPHSNYPLLLLQVPVQ